MAIAVMPTTPSTKAIPNTIPINFMIRADSLEKLPES